MALQRLLAIRKGHRAFIDTYVHALETETEEETFNLGERKTIMDTIEERMDTLKQLDENILNKRDVESMEEEMENTGQYNLKLKIAFRKLQGEEKKKHQMIPEYQPISEEQLREENAERLTSESQVNTNASSFIPRQPVHNSAHLNRLPKLSLPTFDGDILKWQSFWDAFESSIHNNHNLTDVQKFTYLQCQLEGAAARTIGGFALTNDNYLRAISLLRERFGKPHKITHATMQALIQLPAPCNTISSLQNYCDIMETYIRGLESMGHFQDSYGSLLVPIILDKLPSEIRKNIARSHGDNNLRLSELRNALSKELSVMEAGSQSHVIETYDLRSTASFYAGSSSYQEKHNRVVHDKRREMFKCAYCGDSHKSNDCTQFQNTQARLQIVKEKRLCFNCLRKHRVAQCPSQSRCLQCHRKHHTSICNGKAQNAKTSRDSNDKDSRSDTTVLNSFTREGNTGVLLKTAVGTVSSRMSHTDAQILFDEGAQRSFITETLANELQIEKSGTETVHIATFGKKEETVQHLDYTTVYLVTDRKVKIPIRVLIVPSIATPLNTSLQHTASQLPYLRGLKLAHPVTSDREFNISMLIGADYYWDIVENHIVRGNGPTAVKSKIGYLLSGPVKSAGKSNSTDHIYNVITSHAKVDMDIERFWKLESMGISPDVEVPTKSEYLTEYQEKSVEFADGRYTASLPWKPDHDTLPSNFEITKKRTESTVRRLSKDLDMLKKYGEIIDEQERRGFIEKVDKSMPTLGIVHYIPHHPVKKDSATTPIRIVYDCSCRQSSDHASLNDCLESTPPELNELTSILMRFRLHKYAVTTDIEKAFLHIVLNEKDRDATRFLWLSDPSDPDSPLCTYRFKSVLFGATCSPFILNATILKHLELNKSNAAVEMLKNDLYVDNVLSSFPEQSELTKYFHESRDLMKRAGMNLRSWSSNSSELREIVAKENVLDSDEVTKVLGMRWKPEEDCMTFVHRDIPELDVVTKRDILKYSSRIYDPLGLLSPVTVRTKLLLQELWKGKYEWDMPLPRELQNTWNEIAHDLNTAMHTEISRQYISEAEQSRSESDKCLHVFVDASTKSYGAAVYIANNTESRLVMAKNRVAPLKSLTLPQLELMAAVVGARLIKHAQKSLRIKNVVCWSDSQIVLHWLTTEKHLKRFANNRVQEIRTLTDPATWHYCPTQDNPADLLTRGISADQLINSTLWTAGPPWITSQPDWPVWLPNNTQKQTALESEVNDTDNVITKCAEHSHSSVVTSLLCEQVPNVQTVINIDRFSKYNKLLRVTAYVIRFKRNCKHPREKCTDTLTTSELEEAERMWLKSCQGDVFKDELIKLKSDSASRLTLVKQLRLFVDSYGLIHCGGRIHNAQLPETAIFPYLLPRKHPLTRLIVVDAHETQLHAGVNATVTQIRQKYWIPAIRQCVKSILRKCVICARVQGKPYKAPDPPPLPKVRVEESPPFSVTGVDYTGALYAKDRAGNETKVYICLFTCACTRAVHLEIVQDLSTESFLQAFRRFASRRSVPKIMISDNSTTFTGASQYLKKLFDSRTVRDFLCTKGTEWRFIPKRAPWYGGFWERMVGLTKTALKKILGRAFVSIETLQTVVTEIEAVLNDRPITHVSSNLEDMEPLTPSHLMYGRKMTSLPRCDVVIEGDVTSIRSNQQTLFRKSRAQTEILDHFWRRWRSEYLTALREYHKTSGSNQTTIRVGDVVQIHDESPRLHWKIAVVESLIYGNDGLVRAAHIRTMNGQTTRPIVKLYPLETVSSNCD